jgi:enterobactin synthetase component D
VLLTPVDPPNLLPSIARQTAVSYRHEDLAVDDATVLGVALSEGLRRAVPKRQAEYIAGRWCAAVAIRSLEEGFAGQIESVERAPLWPAGFVGSITHTKSFAWAAVARTRDLRGVGVDAETIPSSGGVEAIKRVATSPDDDPAPEGDAVAEAIHYALLFSAKESLFKCLHPLVGKMFWYGDAAVAFVPGAGRFRATLKTELDAEFREGTTLEGSYSVGEGRVYTAVTVAPR